MLIGVIARMGPAHECKATVRRVRSQHPTLYSRSYDLHLDLMDRHAARFVANPFLNSAPLGSSMRQRPRSSGSALSGSGSVSASRAGEYALIAVPAAVAAVSPAAAPGSDEPDPAADPDRILQ